MALLWLSLALLWFAPLNSPHLFDPDEGRYGEIPREMVATGDWVTPRLDGIKYFEKPALGYWATAVAIKLFGQHAWTVRLWPALAGFLGLLLTGWLARRLYGPRAALLALLVQAGAMLYIALSRIATLDMGLSFALQLAM
ncbi:MAG: ArnT family glycosyltransferase, partial [Steroidobacteraceae bacterium]